MKKWVFVSDLSFAFLVVFLPALCLLRYFNWSLPLAIIIAALFGAALTFAVGWLKNRKDEKLLLRLGEEREKRLLLSHLALLPPKRCLQVIYANPSLQEKNGKVFAEIDGSLVFPLFLWRPLQTQDVLPVVTLALQEEKPALILCDEITAEAGAFLAQFDVAYKQGENIYKTLKEENRLPEKYVSEPYFTKKKKRLPRVWFAKSNSRRFLTCGSLLLLSSLLVPFPIYYLVFGGLLLVAAVLIRVFGYR